MAKSYGQSYWLLPLKLLFVQFFIAVFLFVFLPNLIGLEGTIKNRIIMLVSNLLFGGLLLAIVSYIYLLFLKSISGGKAVKIGFILFCSFLLLLSILVLGRFKPINFILCQLFYLSYLVPFIWQANKYPKDVKDSKNRNSLPVTYLVVPAVIFALNIVISFFLLYIPLYWGFFNNTDVGQKLFIVWASYIPLGLINVFLFFLILFDILFYNKKVIRFFLILLIAIINISFLYYNISVFLYHFEANIVIVYGILFFLLLCFQIIPTLFFLNKIKSGK